LEVLEKKNNPIGSMYAIYGNMDPIFYHQYTPVMLAYIPAPWIRHGNGPHRFVSVTFFGVA
jgi:hypothetical protein